MSSEQRKGLNKKLQSNESIDLYDILMCKFVCNGEDNQHSKSLLLAEIKS